MHKGAEQAATVGVAAEVVCRGRGGLGSREVYVSCMAVVCGALPSCSAGAAGSSSWEAARLRGRPAAHAALLIILHLQGSQQAGTLSRADSRSSTTGSCPGALPQPAASLSFPVVPTLAPSVSVCQPSPPQKRTIVDGDGGCQGNHALTQRQGAMHHQLVAATGGDHL